LNRFILLPGILFAALSATLSVVSLSAGGGQADSDGRAPEASQSVLETPGSPYIESEPIEVDAERLYGIAVAADDRIFVSADSSILIFGRGGEPLGRLELEEPARCLAVGPSGLLYLGMIDHLQVYSDAGRREAIWAGLGSEALITSIFAAEDEVLVADAGNRMVLRFDRGGKLLDYIHGDGTVGPELIIPSPYFDLLVAPRGTLWVTNPGCHRVHSYTTGGEYLGSWGRSAPDIDAFCGCCNPTHIALTPEGLFLTSEKGVPRVKVYDSTGAFQAVVAGPGLFREGTVGLDLAADSRGRVIILDPKTSTVRIFIRERL